MGARLDDFVGRHAIATRDTILELDEYANNMAAGDSPQSLPTPMKSKSDIQLSH